jgi:hypothetical protein
MATSVIIPARNEALTIGPIVNTFMSHAETSGHVYVIIDDATIDNTAEVAVRNDGIPLWSGLHGKGQNVSWATKSITNLGKETDNVILCDADYTGLTIRHVQRLLHPPKRDFTPTMVIGIPDLPEIATPPHVKASWPYVSGFRRLPFKWVPEDGHGYLLETQINRAIQGQALLMQYVSMTGLHSPFQWPLTRQRMAALKADRAWGLRNGVL